MKHKTPEILKAYNRATKRLERFFPSRIVLGVGYPWANGTGKKKDPYNLIAMRNQAVGGRNKRLRFPKTLWEPCLPRYRLVLERVDPV